MFAYISSNGNAGLTAFIWLKTRMLFQHRIETIITLCNNHVNCDWCAYYVSKIFPTHIQSYIESFCLKNYIKPGKRAKYTWMCGNL
jgi:hypothetical protein